LACFASSVTMTGASGQKMPQQSPCQYIWLWSVGCCCAVSCDRVGPLDGQLQYSVTAAKEGFVFTPTDDGIVGHFRSFKLGKIQVQVSTKISLCPWYLSACTSGQYWPQPWLWIVIAASASLVTPKKQKDVCLFMNYTPVLVDLWRSVRLREIFCDCRKC